MAFRTKFKKKGSYKKRSFTKKKKRGGYARGGILVSRGGIRL